MGVEKHYRFGLKNMYGSLGYKGKRLKIKVAGFPKKSGFNPATIP